MLCTIILPLLSFSSYLMPPLLSRTGVLALDASLQGFKVGKVKTGTNSELQSSLLHKDWFPVSVCHQKIQGFFLKAINDVKSTNKEEYEMYAHWLVGVTADTLSILVPV